jgi:tRNA threonylcarbamoyladenosine biosynthesis protein TsaB
MKILAIDSSGLVASAAIWEGASASVTGTILATASTDYKKTHSQTLLPMIDRICAETDSAPDSFDAVAVSAGPGSFTGLRIGSATAKAIAMAADIPIVEIPTLEGLAFNLWGTDKAVCPMMDARRDQVYSGLYGFEGDMLVTYRVQEALALEEMLSFINDFGREVIFLGDGTDAYHDAICAGVKVRYSFAPAHMNRQNAASLACLGAKMFEAGKYVNADDHSPVYLRVSQAEREGAKSFDLVN